MPGRAVEDQPAAAARALALWAAPWVQSLTLTESHDAAGGKPFLIMEAQSGPRSGLCRHGFLKYEDIHRMVWQAVAHDAKGFVFWKWYPFRDSVQSQGRGLCATDGSLTERAVAAGDASRVVNANVDLFLDSHPVQPQVALVYDAISDLKAKIHEGDWGGMTAQDFLGIYKILWREHIPVNVLNSNDLTAEKLRPYRLVIFPFCMCLEKNVAQAIEGYVRQGGTVVVDARFGIMDHRHQGYRITPGLAMNKLFGTSRHDFIGGYSPFEVNMVKGQQYLKDLGPNARLAGGVFCEELQLDPKDKGDVIAAFQKTGMPAVVAKRTGKGKTFLLGFMLGTPLFDKEDAGTADFLRSLLATAGVTAPVRVQLKQGDGPVEAFVHTRPGSDDRLLYLINWSDRPTPLTVSLPWPSNGGPAKATDLVTGKAVQLAVQSPPRVATMTLTLSPGRTGRRTR